MARSRLLAALSVALGLFPELLAVPLVQPAASAMRGEHTEVVLRPWAGMSPAFVQSLLMLALGGVLCAAHGRALLRLEPLRRLAAWGPDRAYQVVMAGIVALAKAQTRLLQNGVLGWYLLVTIGTTVALGGYALATRVGAVAVAFEAVRPVEALVALAMAAGAVAVVRARSLLVAVAALGVVGYGVAVVFLLFRAPTSPSPSSRSRRCRCSSSCSCCAACRRCGLSRRGPSACATVSWPRRAGRS